MRTVAGLNVDTINYSSLAAAVDANKYITWLLSFSLAFQEASVPGLT